MKLLVDQNDSSVKVYALPHQAQDLALAHPGEQGDSKQGFIAMAFDSLQKGLYLAFVQRIKLLPLYSGKDTAVGGIRADVSGSDSLLEGLVEDAVNVLNGFRGQSRLVSVGLTQLVVKTLNRVGI